MQQREEDTQCEQSVIDWLREQLEPDGAWQARLKRVAEEDNLSWSAVCHARKVLGVRLYREGQSKMGNYWALPLTPEQEMEAESMRQELLHEQWLCELRESEDEEWAFLEDEEHD